MTLREKLEAFWRQPGVLYPLNLCAFSTTRPKRDYRQVADGLFAMKGSMALKYRKRRTKDESHA